VPFGGGKSVIVGDTRTIDRRTIFHAHGRFLDRLGGRYIAGEDVGTSAADIHIMREVTTYAAGVTDPSPATAHGVCQATRAAAGVRWGSERLTSRTVALQGCGNVGYAVARELHAEGARLVVTDTDESRQRRVTSELGVPSVAPGEIFDVEADVF